MSRREAAIIGSSLDVCLASDGGLYGAGLYFAENSCKSNPYCQHHGDRGQSGFEQDGTALLVVVLCRVVLGDIYHLGALQSLVKGRCAPGNAAPHSRGGGAFDSTVACGGMQVHREFIVFDNAQVYPEFTILFKYK